MTKKPAATSSDTFKEELKQAVLKIIKDPEASVRDRNHAIANGTRLLLGELKISGGEDGEFFN